MSLNLSQLLDAEVVWCHKTKRKIFQQDDKMFIRLNVIVVDFGYDLICVEVVVY